MVRKWMVPLAAAASLTMSAAVFAAPQHSGQADQAFDQKVVKRIDVDRIYNTVENLSKAPRVAGTDEEYEAVQYIADEFRSYGYDVTVEPFSFMSYKEPDSVAFTVSGFDGVDWQPRTFTYSVNGRATGELVYVGLAKESDVAGMDLTGKIALVKRGEITFADKVRNAAAAGAEAVVIFNHADGVINGTLGGPDERFVPALALTKEQGETLLAKLDAGERLIVTIEVDGAEFTEKTSHNVIAKRMPNARHDTGQAVVVGAHHDSVHGSPGANDDASGIAVTLELARVMANLPIDTELRFITFGAEENGLLGSYDYVSSLSDEDREKIVGMFQLDMVGSRDAGELIMYTVDGEKNTVTDLGAAAGARLSGVVNYGQEGRSDHVPFYEAGIPAALFIHAPLEPWYHSPQDTIDKISKDKLKQVAEIVGAAVYQVARPDTPALERSRVAPKPVEYEFEEREL